MAVPQSRTTSSCPRPALHPAADTQGAVASCSGLGPDRRHDRLQSGHPPRLARQSRRRTDISCRQRLAVLDEEALEADSRTRPTRRRPRPFLTDHSSTVRAPQRDRLITERDIRSQTAQFGDLPQRRNSATSNPMQSISLPRMNPIIRTCVGVSAKVATAARVCAVSEMSTMSMSTPCNRPVPTSFDTSS
jgi:hypothetical protein